MTGAEQVGRDSTCSSDHVVLLEGQRIGATKLRVEIGGVLGNLGQRIDEVVESRTMGNEIGAEDLIGSFSDIDAIQNVRPP